MCEDVLGLSRRWLVFVGLCLHGVGTLCDQTLPPVGQEVTLHPQHKLTAWWSRRQDLHSLVRHRLSRQLVDLSPVFRHGQHEERLVV